MVQRLKWFRFRSALHGFITGLVLFLPTILSGCTASQGIPLVVSDFCALTKDRLPVKLSRSDTLETKRQAVILNDIHFQNCLKELPNAQ